MTNTREEDVTSHSYLGFSVGMGRFGFWYEQKPDGPLTVVSGSPRHGGTGAAIFMRFDPGFDGSLAAVNNLPLLNSRFYLRSEKLTSAFGYSVQVLDIDNDGFDDLLIGSPFHFDHSEEGGGGEDYRNGAVYVYYSRGVPLKSEDSEEAVFKEPIILYGPMFSQFGISLASLGDINKDGYNDFAIGAPYHEKGGAVFIYLGASRNNFDKTPSQIIYGHDFEKNELDKLSRQMRRFGTFGWSLSGGVDMDSDGDAPNTGYPDLLIGSFAADTVVLLRARPIIKLKAEVHTKSINKDDHEGCDDQRQRWAAVCPTFETRVLIESSTAALRSFQLRSDQFRCRLEIIPYKKAGSPRAQFDIEDAEGGRTVKEWNCDYRKNEMHRIFVPKTNRDWLNPLRFRFKIELKLDPVEPYREGDLNLPKLQPILDQKGSRNDFQIGFDKNCGSDNKCQSNLFVTCVFENLPIENGTFMKEIRTENDTTIRMHFDLGNMGEMAYESMLFVRYDGDQLEAPQMKTIGTSQVQIGEYDRDQLSLMLGNPLKSGEKLRFYLDFGLIKGTAQGRPLVFSAIANSTNDEVESSDNQCVKNVAVKKNAELELIGQSQPQIVHYGGQIVGESAMELEEDIGQQVIHRYSLTNRGPWSVTNVTLTIYFPYEVQSAYDQGKWALYIMERPVVKTVVPGQSEKKISFCDLHPSFINTARIRINTLHSLVDNLGQFGTREKRSIREERKIRRRKKRSLRLLPQNFKEASGETVKIVVVSCTDKKTGKCVPIKCHFRTLDNGISAEVEIRSRLWNGTFVEDYRDVEYIRIESYGFVETDPTQGLTEDLRNNQARAITRAYPDLPKIPGVEAVPIWAIIVAIIVGILILLLIVFVCWKCGFFRRDRGPKPQKHQAEFLGAEEFSET